MWAGSDNKSCGWLKKKKRELNAQGGKMQVMTADGMIYTQSNSYTTQNLLVIYDKIGIPFS